MDRRELFHLLCSTLPPNHADLVRGMMTAYWEKRPTELKCLLERAKVEIPPTDESEAAAMRGAIAMFESFISENTH